MTMDIGMKIQNRPKAWSDQRISTRYKQTSADISITGSECKIHLNGPEDEETFFLLWELLFLYDGYFYSLQNTIKDDVNENPDKLYRTAFYRTDRIWLSNGLLARSNRNLSTEVIEKYSYLRNQGKSQKKMTIAVIIPDHDVLVGGFPCQSFSTVNPTKDPFDDRANLYKQMVRIAKDKQPKVIIAENVKGLFTLHKGKIFQRVKEAFEEAGYTLSYKLPNAANYGVPQKRERVILVGFRKDFGIEFEFPQETTANNWVPLSVAVPELRIKDEKYYFSEKAVQGMKNAKPNMKRGLWQKLDEPCLTVTSHLAKVSLNSRDPVLLVEPEKELYRRFTPREAARIQSFPDEFEFAGSETDAYRQIGDAVPPVLFWHIANKVASYLG